MGIINELNAFNFTILLTVRQRTKNFDENSINKKLMVYSLH